MLKEIKFKYSKKLISNSLTYKFSLIICFSLLIFSLILIGLYIIGNYQNFQDQTQQFLLGLLSYVAIFNAILSVLLIIESIFKIVLENRKIKSAVYLFFLVLIFIFELFSLEISTVISYLSKGLTGN